MTETLRAAADLVDKLGGDFEAVLPETEPVIDCEALAADRLELRQVAGISAGGSLELLPGNYDFGPVRHGPGRLGNGDPDSVSFTLQLDDNLATVIGPGEAPVALDDQPIVGPTDLAGRVINAGTARFVVARPRPPRKRDGITIDPGIDELDPWVVEPIPGPMTTTSDPSSLIARRRRLHRAADEICHRVDGGPPLVWDRGPEHRLFGTAVVAMADISLEVYGLELSAPVPVSVDLLGSPTMVVGSRQLQLAVVRHALVALATSTHPRDLQVGVLSDGDELDFARRLPHARGMVEDRNGAGAGRRRRLLVVDQPARHGRWSGGRWTLPGLDDESIAVLAMAGEGDPLWPGADVLTVTDEATISVFGGRGETPIGRATPVGFARSMADDLVTRLGADRGAADLR